MTNASGPAEPPRTRAPRGTLSKDAVVAAACELADAEGLDALTIRAVADRLGSRPMSLYRHIANKDELLDALVELVYAKFERPDPHGPDWRAELRRRGGSVRTVLVRHPWALTLVETRTGPDRPVAFAHAEAVLATLVGAGCPPRLAARAFVTLDSYVYGFALQEITTTSTDPGDTVTDDVAEGLRPYPTMASVADAVAEDSDYAFGAEFEAGLDMVLDGIERWRDEVTPTSGRDRC